MRSSISLISCLAIVAGAAACGTSTGVSSELVLEYDFNLEDETRWSFGLSDFVPEDEPDIEFQSSQRPLPASFGQGQAFYQAGTNSNDDLWMYYTRPVSGFVPGQTYQLRFQVEFATTYHGGCTDGPGLNVVIKAGASLTPPERVLAQDGTWRMNVDKGEGIDPGDDAHLLGDIRNGALGCPSQPQWQARAVASQGSPLEITADESGVIWIFFGTESNFDGRHEVYFGRFFVGVREAP